MKPYSKTNLIFMTHSTTLMEEMELEIIEYKENYVEVYVAV